MSRPDYFPTHINVGSIRYDVVEHDTKDSPNDYGEFDPCEFELKVDSNASPLMQLIVLWHEWMHALMQHNGMSASLADSEQEKLCDVIGYAMADLFEQGVIRFNTNKGRKGKTTPTEEDD